MVELILTLPLLAAVALSGFTLTRVAVARAELRVATVAGVSEPNPAQAVRRIVSDHGLEATRLTIRTEYMAQLTRVAATYRLVLPWWPGDDQPELTLSATAARGRALLCTR